jgi:hypothetical protein
MKNFSGLILLIIFSCLKIYGAEFKYEELTNGFFPALSGNFKVNYGFDKNGKIMYMVIAPTQYKSGLLVKYVFKQKLKSSTAYIEYKGLILDEPCKCKPLVICSGNSVKRYAMKNINANEIDKIISSADTIEKLTILFAIVP